MHVAASKPVAVSAEQVPADVVAKLSDHVGKTMQNPALREKIAKSGAQVSVLPVSISSRSR